MKGTLVKILIVVVIAIVALVVLRHFGLVNNQMNEGLQNMNAELSESDRQAGLNATAGPGTTQTHNLEEMNNTCNLLLGHIWRQHECLHVETVEEELDSVCLYNVISIYH